jgi:hypothetical protein
LEVSVQNLPTLARKSEGYEASEMEDYPKFGETLYDSPKITH